MDCKRLDIGLVRSNVARMSVTGETGFEINCKMGDHIALRRILLEAGVDKNIREVGFNAMLSQPVLRKVLGFGPLNLRKIEPRL